MLLLQIENAIEIASNPSSDSTLKSQAVEFINQLSLNPQAQAWQAGINLFTRSPRASEVVRLVSLELVNTAVNRQILDSQNLVYLKNALLDYVRRTYSANAQDPADPSHLQNKITQTLTYLFVCLYKEGWESFIDDFLTLTLSPDGSQGDNLPGVFMYLRVIDSVHDEIGDLMLTRQGQESRRNNELKDLVRERDMRKIAASWQRILAQFSNQNDAVVELTLKVIGKWVSWIDISLIINQEMLNLLLPLVGRAVQGDVEDKVREAAINTLTDIVSKKMQPGDKMEMISFLKLREIISELLQSPPLNEYKGTPRYDNDLAEVVAKLLNTVMTDIVRVLEDSKVDEATRRKAEQLLQDFLPSLLRLFSDEYDEVCSTVIPSLTDLLTFLRKLGTLPAGYTEMLPPILSAIVSKMRFDETSTWGNEDEQTEEAEFIDLRKRLQILQKSVAAVDQNLYIDFLSNLVGRMFTLLDQQSSGMDWRDLDLALHEIYLFGELALPNAGIAHKSEPNPVATDRLAVMMSKMVDSDIANFPHPAILLQYMEICVRYYSFFETHQQYIPRVLENFVRLVHHNHVRVRTRSWYLFMRFVKQLRAQVGNVAKTIIQSIADLLPIKAEAPSNEADDDMSSDESDHSPDSIFNSQLFLFEAVGLISSTSTTPPQEQALYARSVMDPLFNDMEVYLPRAKSGDAQAVQQIHHIVLALGTLATGFADWNPNQTNKQPPPKEISEEFARGAGAILVSLNELNANGEIRYACRSAFSRLLGVLGSAVLPQLPQWIEGLLSRSASKDEMALFLRLLEQVVFNFKGEIYNVLDVLLTPLLNLVFAGLSQPINGTDDGIQLQELRREYVTFIQVILINDLGGVLVSEANQGAFESLITSIIAIAKTISHGHLVASRIGFNCLQRMASLWGGPDIATIGKNPVSTGQAAQPTIPGFDQFMIERFHLTCWEVLQDREFKPFSDAQSRQVLSEIAGVEQTIYAKTGDAFIRNLQEVIFPRVGIAGDMAAEFISTLTTSTDRKVVVNYIQNLLKSRGA
ncbi:Exportin-T [Rhypophila decipiens]|uniref:Exportin-T n=1 Tax=Rhypophila decipiens TaxID=261697 RepID=A0AAN6YDJ5_9PEZI|nr:Exportin-T [Rhypophila decipiens]